MTTPAYMAPEQARGVKAMTPAVDVFSLGGVIAFAATGEPPFGAGSGTDLLFRIVHEEPDLQALRALDGELADIVESCLLKEPAARPSAAELLELAGRRTAPGDPQWPAAIAERIAVRAEFAATPAESVPPEPPEPQQQESSEAGTVPIVYEPVQEPQKPSDSGERSDKGDRERRRKRLVVILPLILSMGTAGTLIALNKVPFVSSAGGGAPQVSVSSRHSGATATDSTTARPTPSQSAHPSASASAGASKTGSAAANSSAAGDGHSTGGGGSGGTSGSGDSNSGGGGSATKTATSATTAAASGPSGPGSGEGLVSGSEVTVNNCAGWLDLPSYLYFVAKLSAGSSASCKESFTFASGFGDEGPGSATTSDISASDGNTASTSSCGGGCAYFGSYQLYAKICVWNTADSGDQKCTKQYEYNSDTGKVS